MARLKQWVRTSGLVTANGSMPFDSRVATVPLGNIHAPFSAATLVRTIASVQLVVTPTDGGLTPAYNWQGRAMARFYVSYQTVTDNTWIGPLELSSSHVVGLQHLTPAFVPVDPTAPLGSGTWFSTEGLESKGMRKPPTLGQNASVRIGGLWGSADSIAEGVGPDAVIAWLWTASCLFEAPF